MRKANDRPEIQEHDVELLAGESMTGVESFAHTYGFHSVPREPDDQEGRKAAEVLVGHLHGNRSHPVVLGVIDHRYQPKDWKPGESGLHDHQGQKMHVTNDGIQVDGGDKKLPVTITVGDAKDTFDKDFKDIIRGNAKFKVENGKITATVDGLSWTLTASRLDLGGTGGSGVMTEAGISSKVFAVL